MRLGRSFRVLTLGCLPAVLTAQRAAPPNLRGERASDVGGRGFQMPRSTDLEDHSPVGVVLDRKKKLALADSQVTALRAIAKALHEKNAEFYRMWDSVRVSMRFLMGGSSGGGSGGGGGSRGGGDIAQAGGGRSAADQGRIANARTMLQGLTRAIRENDDWSRQETLRVLNDEQKAKAEQFWKDDADDFRGGMGGGMGGGGRPPGP